MDSFAQNVFTIIGFGAELFFVETGVCIRRKVGEVGMIDREKVIKGLKIERECVSRDCDRDCGRCDLVQERDWLLSVYDDALTLLKEQEDLKQKMWNALYAEEDELEKKFIGTEEHNDWFDVYRPWLQRGFEIAIKVIAEQDGR